jgi:hypothetical protein
MIVFICIIGPRSMFRYPNEKVKKHHRAPPWAAEHNKTT